MENENNERALVPSSAWTKAVYDEYRVAVDPYIQAKSTLLMQAIPSYIMRRRRDGTMEIVDLRYDDAVNEKLAWFDEQINAIAEHYSQVLNDNIIPSNE